MPFEDFVVCDADMHVMEPADLWQRYMTPEYRHAAPIGMTELKRDIRVKVKSQILLRAGPVRPLKERGGSGIGCEQCAFDRERADAGELQRGSGRLVDQGPDLRHLVGRLLVGDREPDDRVGGVAVPADEPRVPGLAEADDAVGDRVGGETGQGRRDHLLERR